MNVAKDNCGFSKQTPQRIVRCKNPIQGSDAFTRDKGTTVEQLAMGLPGVVLQCAVERPGSDVHHDGRGLAGGGGV
ncbi:hypothetical protein [Polymorphobacter megasporae]|uniref:hypothetical protein n=1 Tax=Glacieibacterium megasporae TaxID=2835787 RepID=UPI0021054248|nr:hypothetical protein [Polymorphobacter megasporae]